MHDIASVVEFEKFPWIYGSTHARDGAITPWMQLHPAFVLGSVSARAAPSIQIRAGWKEDGSYPLWEHVDIPTEAEEDENCKRSIKCL